MALDFYKASTLCNEFIVQRFATPDHEFTTPKLGFDTQVMIMCLSPSVVIVLVPMLHHKTYKKTILRCKHLDEVILFALECAHLDYCILSGTLHK